MGFSEYDIDYFANISHRVVMLLTQPAGGNMVTQHLTCMQRKLLLYGTIIKLNFAVWPVLHFLLTNSKDYQDDSCKRCYKCNPFDKH